MQRFFVLNTFQFPLSNKMGPLKKHSKNLLLFSVVLLTSIRQNTSLTFKSLVF